MFSQYLCTSESVSKGHPDKICDQISDAILDECLKQDVFSRVAVEVAIKDHKVVVMGEISSSAKYNIKDIVLHILSSVGYNNVLWGINLDKIEIEEYISEQSKNIDYVVSQKDGKIGAGDQGIVFGYACLETSQYMPLAIKLCNDLMQKHSIVRDMYDDIIGPDAKTQITLTYENGVPVNIHTVILSTQHSNKVELSYVKNLVKTLIIDPILPKELLTNSTRIMINPAGLFEIGGPVADAGLTGRKIIADTYGGIAHHGGGAFSGKDPTKVDRSGAYAARQVAKSLVSAGFAKEIEVEVSYAIGYIRPVSVRISDNRAKLLSINNEILSYIEDLLSPQFIIDRLDLMRPIYHLTSTFGHFGKDCLPWENVIEFNL